MNLKYFSLEAYKKIKSDLDLNREKYYSEDVWIDKYFDEAGITNYITESDIAVPNISLVYSGDSDDTKNSDDLINTKTLYGSFKDKITPSEASDPLLWTALCHTDFREYILHRWKKGDGEVNIEERFFSSGKRGSLTYYNGVSRLWWSGYLTYEDDKESSNPWMLTTVLFSAQQIQKDLFDQPYSMNKVVVKGLLNALKRIQEVSCNSATQTFRKCTNSFINHYGAVAVLDFLTAEEIEELAYNYMLEQI